MDLIKKTIQICETVKKGTTQAMADGDIIVPDIKPDILKIIQVDADACVTDKYIENGRLIVCGRVDYKILYVPDRENERIKSILTSMEFKQAADCGGADACDTKLFTAVNVERVEFNAVNSRKIRLRAVIGVDYEVCRLVNTEICVDIDDESAEKKKKIMRFENTVDISEHEFSIKEMLEVPSGQRSINEILKVDVSVSDTEYKTVSGKVIVKGNAAICILYSDDDGELKYIEAEVPFTEVFDMEGAGEDTVCEADYCVIGVMCETDQDNDGDMRIVNIEIDVCAVIRGIDTVECEMLEDCYIPYMKTDCEREKIKINETVERPTTQNTIREIIEFPSNAPSVQSVYNVMTDAEITKAELKRNKILCEGKIDAYILYLTDNLENPVYSIKKEFKFSYMIDCETVDESVEIEAKAAVKHVSYNINSSGDLELRCIPAVDIKLVRSVDIENIVSVNTEERNKRNGIIIYFSKNGENVWDVSKKYNIPQSKIMQFNDISDEKLSSGTRLFIPS